MKRWIFSLIAWILIAGSWLLAASFPQSPTARLILMVVCILGIIPVVLTGRWLLDHRPTVEQAEAATTWVHYVMAFLLGSAVIEATLYSQGAGILTIPFAPWIGLTLMFISSIVMLLVVANLALKGLGAPLAISLTRKVATEWFYAWTRNPIAITAFIFLIGIGIFLQSGIFLVWVMLIVMPCFILFVKVYEERELEIRFGQSYLDYKARTPGFFPRKPQ